MMESGAIMLYLAEKYKKFLPTKFDHRFKCIEWLNFQTASQGPMLGQAHHFLNLIKESLNILRKGISQRS